MKRNKYSLSNYKLLSCDMGWLVPINVMEVLPGDTIQQATSALIRCSPLLAPIMHPVEVRIHHFYCPTRELWADFENFITGGPDGNDDSVPPWYQPSVSAGSMADYLGLPTQYNGQEVSVLPQRMYNRIWNEYYRDQDLQDELVISTASGEDTTTATDLQRIAWEKDYFTGARPTPQKGDDVIIPLGTTAPMLGTGSLAQRAVTQTGPNTALEIISNSAQVTDAPQYTGSLGLNVPSIPFSEIAAGLEADLENASSTTVQQFRLAMALQRYQEARSRYGSRYVEYLRYLGINPSDARLVGPEYIGGGKQVIQFSEVLQSAEGDDPVGTLRGHGIGAMRSNRYRKFFEEHGYIMSLLSVRPKTIYADGISKMWTRKTREDYHQRELEQVGAVPVLNQEVYAYHATPDGVFGYQDRYDEYRRQESSIAGEMRSDMDHWHMARKFASDPSLNEAFIECNPSKRNFADQNGHALLIMANHSIQARRMVGRVR